jgi:hypothetical protein
MTRRRHEADALPGRDDSIEALSAADRERIGREWLRRAEVELTAATLSAQIARGLLLDGAARDVLELAAQAVVDEVRHAHLCHAVAERYLARKADPPHSRPIDEPVFGDCPAELSRLFGVVLHSCISETMATVCLRDGLGQCVSPTAKAATKQLLEDDLNHARLGWAHLASSFVSAEAKRHIGLALPTLLRLGHDSWLCEKRPHESDPAHGVLGMTGFLALTQNALANVILPGFDHVGVDTQLGRIWFADITKRAG